jgi:S1-C subfamily serine protease
VLKDETVDLAVLRIKSKESFPVLPIGNSDTAEVGDLVLAIGNPFGVGQTVTSGIVSGLARNQITDGDFGFFIQTDASINPGNSGGALMNMKGELIGVNTAIFSRGGGSNGVGFAIPANLVKVFLAAASEGKTTFDRPYVGATFDAVTSDIAEALGLKAARGALVVRTVEGGPADKAGLKPGEVITAVNGISVEHPDALGYRLTTAGLGKKAELTVQTSDGQKQMTLMLNTAPETTPRDERLIEGRNPFAGLHVANLSPKLATELRVPVEKTGVIVTDVTRGSPSGRLGFQPNDIIVSINGADVATTKAMTGMIDQDPGFWRVEIERDGQRIRQFFR